jgi:hypothetical protein
MRKLFVMVLGFCVFTSAQAMNNEGDLTAKFEKSLISGSTKKMEQLLIAHPDFVNLPLKNGLGTVITAIQSHFKNDAGIESLAVLKKHNADFNFVAPKINEMPFAMTPLAYCLWQAPYLNQLVDALIGHGADLNHESVKLAIGEVRSKFGDPGFASEDEQAEEMFKKLEAQMSKHESK